MKGTLLTSSKLPESMADMSTWEVSPRLEAPRAQGQTTSVVVRVQVGRERVHNNNNGHHFSYIGHITAKPIKKIISGVNEHFTDRP